MRRAAVVIAVLVLLGVLATGVYLIYTNPGAPSSQPSAEKTPSQPSPVERPMLLVYRTGIFNDMTTINPWARFGPNNTVWNAYGQGLLYPQLFIYGHQRLDWIPLLAADLPTPLEFDVERKLWRSTVNIRPRQVWSDGTPVTARDVKFTYDSVQAFGANKLGWGGYVPEDVFDHVEIIDDHTIEFFLKKRDARYNFQILLTPILQQAYWEPKVTEALASQDPITAIFQTENKDEPVYGPYLRGTWERGAFLNRLANSAYPRTGERQLLYADGAVRIVQEPSYDWIAYGKPQGEPILEIVNGPYVQEVLYRVYGSQAAGVLALISGEVDYLFNPLGLEQGFQEQLKGQPGITLIQNPTNGIRYMSFNMRREPMNIKAFRQAVAVLIDREFVAQRVLQGVAFPLTTVVPPGNTFWHNPNVPVYGQGMNRAQRIKEAVRLLKAAGFSWEQEPEVTDDPNSPLARRGKGLKLPNGQPVRDLELLAPGQGYDPLRSTFALWIERWLGEVGIPLQANLTGFDLIVDRVFNQQNFDLWILGWSLNPYPSFLFDFFHSSRTGLRDDNAEGYQNPQYDRLVEQFTAETEDFQKAQQLAFRLQEFLADDLPYVPLFETPIVEAFRSDRLKYPYVETLNGLQYCGVVSLVCGFINHVRVLE